MASAAVPLARDAITSPLSLAIFAASFLLIASARVDSLWVMLGAALVGLHRIPVLIYSAITVHFLCRIFV